MIEQLQSLMKALEAGSYNAQPQQAEKKMSILNGKMRPGHCKITITDKQTGEVLLEQECFVKNYSISRSRGTQPIYTMGRYDAAEFVECVRPPSTEFSLNGIILPSPEETPNEAPVPKKLNFFSNERVDMPDYFKKQCEHRWKRYEGFMENYDFCEICNEKRK